ncbi:concanavalin A-like lectin/glucanase superfamily protein [Dyadobacter jejuensis]|uniref:Concanavalin A-like lectin/glucanase superfamily protein n=1 Tax=Dyadobacter jejuensis TaxID=1082580 RepID=A0A316AFA0_9BACT|nr:OmpA family protein [Dyadobacter jejuensis]PWJ55574.1 concanavalin A-like lectin/glucanase superfamily protein [Dyadobacter jejuensis]
MIHQKFKYYLAVLTYLLLTIPACLAQQQWTYDFNNGLMPIESEGIGLKVLGTPGKFVKEDIPDTEYLQRTVYQFEENSGLQFNNYAAKGLLNKSFTVEVYFKMDKLDSWKRILDFKNRKSDYGSYIYDGKLNFYDYAMSEKAPVRANQYVHYVYSRDFETKTIKMYINGQLKVEFIDPGIEGVLDSDQVLNFFQDDLIANHEASAGSVALIRLYDRVMTPVFIRRSYHSLRRPPQNKKQQQESETVETQLPEINVSQPSHRLNVTGKVYNSNNLQLVDQADIQVNRADDNSLVAETKTVNGAFSLELGPYQSYKITAQADGYAPKRIPIKTESRNIEIKSLIALSPTPSMERLATVYFEQSEPELTDNAKAKLSQLAQYFLENTHENIFLQGHTDNAGDFDKNIKLSAQRASMCRDYLVGLGLSPHRIQVQGYGSTRPVEPNSTESKRKGNRRVEIWKRAEAIAPAPHP